MRRAFVELHHRMNDAVGECPEFAYLCRVCHKMKYCIANALSTRGVGKLEKAAEMSGFCYAQSRLRCPRFLLDRKWSSKVLKCFVRYSFSNCTPNNHNNNNNNMIMDHDQYIYRVALHLFTCLSGNFFASYVVWLLFKFSAIFASFIRSYQTSFLAYF